MSNDSKLITCPCCQQQFVFPPPAAAATEEEVSGEESVTTWVPVPDGISLHVETRQEARQRFAFTTGREFVEVGSAFAMTAFIVWMNVPLAHVLVFVALLIGWRVLLLQRELKRFVDVWSEEK
jgi:hypothetical protein